MAKVVKKKTVAAPKFKKPFAVPKKKKQKQVKTPMSMSKPMPITISKKKKKRSTSENIVKKPLSEEERKKKIQDDLINIAKRYERMLLYDDAIKYYKKLGMTEDIDRLMKTKEETYINKAREFEAQHQYEDALRLYENLKRTEDVERLNKLLGKRDLIAELETGVQPQSQSQLQPPAPAPDIHPPISLEPVTSIEQIPQDAATSPGTMAKNNEPKETEMIAPPAIESEMPRRSDEKTEDILFRETINQDPPVYPEELAQDNSKATELTLTQELIPPQPPTPDEPTGPKYAQKAFKICPYCGEELNLPKKPNFCPYCKERLI